jgi:uncharacterized protein (TIGR01319 family)
MALALLIDFGSTFTKLTAVDLAGEAVVGTAQAPSTVATDIMVGLGQALARLETSLPVSARGYKHRLACSSAAGGLRMVAIGLVPELTAEAAKRAALGAGAKVVGVFAYELAEREWREVAALQPDLVLLAGGTDGGNAEVIVRNARRLAALPMGAPVVVAGNKSAAAEVQAILEAGRKTARVVENVMPELGQLNVDPARQAIREFFIERIILAKGIKRAEAFVDQILMPTPAAVLNAAALLARGAEGEPGLGDLVVVDVGGATTDVHSVAAGQPTRAGVTLKGLPEPEVKRTVEGDLGIRWNAPTILAAAGPARFAPLTWADGPAVEDSVRRLAAETDRLPEAPTEAALDVALARVATEIAVERHAGTLQQIFTPLGEAWVQYGKDLTAVGSLIGTGGIFAYGADPAAVLAGSLFDPANPTCLRPRAPACYIDKRYIMAAMGLLAEVAPGVALRALKRELVRVGVVGETKANAERWLR